MLGYRWRRWKIGVRSWLGTLECGLGRLWPAGGGAIPAPPPVSQHPLFLSVPWLPCYHHRQGDAPGHGWSGNGPRLAVTGRSGPETEPRHMRSPRGGGWVQGGAGGLASSTGTRTLTHTTTKAHGPLPQARGGRSQSHRSSRKEILDGGRAHKYWMGGGLRI